MRPRPTGWRSPLSSTWTTRTATEWQAHFQRHGNAVKSQPDARKSHFLPSWMYRVYHWTHLPIEAGLSLKRDGGDAWRADRRAMMSGSFLTGHYRRVHQAQCCAPDDQCAREFGNMRSCWTLVLHFIYRTVTCCYMLDGRKYVGP